MPDSFARRQDLKKEEAACWVRFPPLVGQIYYIFRRKANPAFRILTFGPRSAAGASSCRERPLPIGCARARTGCVRARKRGKGAATPPTSRRPQPLHSCSMGKASTSRHTVKPTKHPVFAQSAGSTTHLDGDVYAPDAGGKGAANGDFAAPHGKPHKAQKTICCVNIMLNFRHGGGK